MGDFVGYLVVTGALVVTIVGKGEISGDFVGDPLGIMLQEVAPL